MNELHLTPKAFRALLPGKNARIVEYLVKDEHIAPLDALRKFYATNTYRALETEETKCWWESPAQIYHDYLVERESLRSVSGKL